VSVSKRAEINTALNRKWSTNSIQYKTTLMLLWHSILTTDQVTRPWHPTLP